jgi:hypothetical protein
MNLHTSSSAKSKYFYYPSSGFAEGCNLYDIISSLDPFTDLGKKKAIPYTIKVNNKFYWIICFHIKGADDCVKSDRI